MRCITGRRLQHGGQVATYHAGSRTPPVPRPFASVDARTWFDLQGAAAYLAISEQTLSRYVKERIAPASVKVGNGRRFHRSDLDAWIRAGGIFASRRWRVPMPIETK